MEQLLTNPEFQLFLALCTVVGGLATVPQIVAGFKWLRARFQSSSQSEDTKEAVRVQYVYEGSSGFSKGLFAAFPWALIFAAIGEYLLVAVLGLSHSSVLYTLLILLFWAAGIPVGLAARGHSWKFARLVGIIGWVAMLGVAILLSQMNTAYLSR